jgi:hypothetical protein
MNYIKQLSVFFDKVASDERLTPFHISLYMALFQFWNLNRFENPISIARNEILKLSRLGSTHTYYKCLNDLHNWTYIDYLPSKNPLKGSLVNMSIFDTSNAQAVLISCSKNDTSCAQAVHPSINNINIINNKTYREDQTQNEIKNLNSFSNQKSSIANQELDIKNPESEILSQKEKRKKVPRKKEKEFQVPTIEEVLAFFNSESFPEIEAKKFFNHFESNGWKVGGKTPMKNWHAAARNWILNSKNFSGPTKPGSTNLNQNKRYDIPL